MADENDIRILAWPAEEPLTVEHAATDMLPVRVGFASTPARVVVESRDRPLDVAMRMGISAADPVPLCVSVCEPICITSSYTITVEIFDRPVATIRLRGRTQVAPCNDQPRPVPVGIREETPA